MGRRWQISTTYAILYRFRYYVIPAAGPAVTLDAMIET
jgi:hypothetical protein